MGFLRRLLGGSDQPRDAGEAPAPNDAGTVVEDEAARDHELLRADAERLDDDLLQRQLRYADRSWVPPRQGGEARAGEAEGEER